MQVWDSYIILLLEIVLHLKRGLLTVCNEGGSSFVVIAIKSLSTQKSGFKGKVFRY